MKFNSLEELNNYVNNNPYEIEYIDISNSEVKYKYIRSMNASPELISEKYKCYIILKDKLSYDRFLDSYKVVHKLPSVNTVYLEISLEDFGSLRDNIDVEKIELIDENIKIKPLANIGGVDYPNKIINWGAARMDLNDKWKKGFTGKNIKVAVLDMLFVNGLSAIPFKQIITDFRTHNT